MKIEEISVLKSDDAHIEIHNEDGEMFTIKYTDTLTFDCDKEWEIEDEDGESILESDERYKELIKIASDELFYVEATILRRYDSNGSWTHDSDVKLGDFTPDENSMWRVHKKLYRY